jgi:hypothetical protein
MACLRENSRRKRHGGGTISSRPLYRNPSYGDRVSVPACSKSARRVNVRERF